MPTASFLNDLLSERNCTSLTIVTDNAGSTTTRCGQLPLDTSDSSGCSVVSAPSCTTGDFKDCDCPLNEDNSKDPLITRSVGSLHCNLNFEKNKEGKGYCAPTKKPIFPSDCVSEIFPSDERLEKKDYAWIFDSVLDTINS
jgi:hypothetical protein